MNPLAELREKWEELCCAPNSDRDAGWHRAYFGVSRALINALLAEHPELGVTCRECENDSAMWSCRASVERPYSWADGVPFSCSLARPKQEEG